MPNHAFAPAAFPGEVYYGQCWVPVDDVTCWIYTYSWLPDRPFTNSERDASSPTASACTPRSTPTTCRCATRATTT